MVCDPSATVLGQELPALISEGYTSFKVFMTCEDLRLNDAQILDTMDLARRPGALVMVHCESEDAIRYLIGRHEDVGDIAPKAHATTRPIVVEREAGILPIRSAAEVALRVPTGAPTTIELMTAWPAAPFTVDF
jgi:dihydropyrimidinase